MVTVTERSCDSENESPYFRGEGALKEDVVKS